MEGGNDVEAVGGLPFVYFEGSIYKKVLAEMLLIQLLEHIIVVSGVFLKGSTIQVFVANTAVMFAVVIIFTREGLREVAEAAWANRHFDWQF